MRQKDVKNYKTRYHKVLNLVEIYAKIAKEKLQLSDKFALPANQVLEDLLSSLEEMLENETLLYP